MIDMINYKEFFTINKPFSINIKGHYLDLFISFDKDLNLLNIVNKYKVDYDVVSFRLMSINISIKKFKKNKLTISNLIKFINDISENKPFEIIFIEN